MTVPPDRLSLRPLGADDAHRLGPTPIASRAFGVRTDLLRRLPGGQGLAWTDGRLVLKPVGFAPEHDWVCDVYAAWPAWSRVRVPAPVAPTSSTSTAMSTATSTETSTAAPRTGSGPHWSYDGWGAHVFVPGRETELPAEIERVRDASLAFHELLAPLPRPAFLDDRDDPWSYGDRLAWEGATPIGDRSTLEVIAQLRAATVPVHLPDQVIHGDVLPNVLLADGRPPAVIDWPPYYRPAAMGNAIAVTDAVTFRAAPLSLLETWMEGAQWQQLLIRALLYRLGTTGIFDQHERLRGTLVRHVELVRPVVAAVLSG